MQFIFKHQTTLAIIATLLFCSALASCTKNGNVDVAKAQQYTVNAAKLTNSVALLNASFKESSDIAKSIKPHLTASELATLDNATITLATFHAQVNKLLGPNNNVTDLLINATAIKPMYTNSRKAYIEARNIIVLHWDKLPPNSKASLQEFDTQAHKAHDAIIAIQSISNNPDSPVNITQAVGDFINVGAAAAQVLQMTGALK